MSFLAQHTRIAIRLKTLREERGLSQVELAAAMGIKDRQTISAIESGSRRVTAEELVRAAEVLRVDFDTFIDPYRLVGEGRFSFRAKGVAPEVLAAFEERAGRWIATYRELSLRSGAASSPLARKLELTPDSSFEEAAANGEGLWEEWQLGEIPATRLEEAIERELGMLVLYVDAPEGVSGAASYLPRYHTILVNRDEAPGRRRFDIAHELFHILTWDAMPPQRVEPWEVKKTKGNRPEYLAENFAAGLLMPSPLILRRWEERGGGDVAHWVARTASELRVSTSSLQWRLVNLSLISRPEAEALQPRRVRPSGAADQPPLLFNRRFITLVADAVDAGRLSLRRAGSLLGLPIADLAELCAAHGRPLSYDLT